jgi:hypothetical protein
MTDNQDADLVAHLTDNDWLIMGKGAPQPSAAPGLAASRLTALSSENARLREHVSDLETRKAEVHALHERTERNRDMWKGQVERQSEELASLRQKLEQKDEALERVIAYLEGGNPLHMSGGFRNTDLRDCTRTALGVSNG